MATLTFAHRTIYVSGCGRSVLLFASLLILFVWSVRRRRWALAVVCLPAVFSFAFTSFLTQSVPRYSVPSMPVLWMALACCGYGVYRRFFPGDGVEQTVASAGFDPYALKYDEVLHRGLVLSGEDKAFFGRGRVAWVTRCLARMDEAAPRFVLDYGCGTGSTIPFFKELLHAAHIVGRRSFRTVFRGGKKRLR